MKIFFKSKAKVIAGLAAFCSTVLSLPTCAQSVEWNYNSGTFQSGQIQLRDGDGNTVTSNINNFAARNFVRTAPVMMQVASATIDYPIRITESTYDGNINIRLGAGTTHKDGPDQICANEHPGYHMCTEDEFFDLSRSFKLPPSNSLVHKPLDSEDREFWVHSQRNRFSTTHSCDGWTSNSTSLYTVSVSGADGIWTVTNSYCSKRRAILCCAD